MIRVMIVDDEPLVRRGLARFLEDEADMQVVAACRDGEEAVREIREKSPDLVFLDVQMPGKDGFEVLDSIPQGERPGVVFVTAYDRYAVKAFEIRAIDYLLKPFDRPRFRQTLQHVREHIGRMRSPSAQRRIQELLEELKGREADEPVRLMVRSRGRVHFVDASEVVRVEAAGNYVYLHTRSGRHLMRSGMRELERLLPSDAFLRVHRSAILRLDAVRAVESDPKGARTAVLSDGSRVSIGRTYQRRFLERLDLH